MNILEELKQAGERELWMLRRLKESRGFVSKRIVVQISMMYLVAYGTCFVTRYEKFTCILRHEDVMIDVPSNSIIWKHC